MRISDWSSDVCSSDLGPRVPGAWLCQPGRAAAAAGHARTAGRTRPRLRRRAPAQHLREPGADGTRHPHLTPAPHMLAGQPADRKTVVKGKSVSVRVDLVGSTIIKKKIN